MGKRGFSILFLINCLLKYAYNTKLNKNMKEVIITKYGAPSVLQVREKRNPNPRESEVLVRNHFTGVNFSEIMARMRLYPGAPKPPTTLGAEACGIIESVGKN